MGLLDYLTTHAMDEDYAFVSRAAPQRQGMEPEERTARAPTARSRRCGGDGAVRGARRHRGGADLAQLGDRRARAHASWSARSTSAVPRSTATARGSAPLQTDVAPAAEPAAEQRHLGPGRARAPSTLLGMRDRHHRGAWSRASAWSPTTPRAPTAPATRCSTPTCRQLVNGLWEAGAEAISLNGQRLTNLSTIRAGG